MNVWSLPGGGNQRDFAGQQARNRALKANEPTSIRDIVKVLHRHGRIYSWSTAPGGLNVWLTEADWHASNGLDGTTRQAPMPAVAARNLLAAHGLIPAPARATRPAAHAKVHANVKVPLGLVDALRDALCDHPHLAQIVAQLPAAQPEQVAA